MLKNTALSFKKDRLLLYFAYLRKVVSKEAFAVMRTLKLDIGYDTGLLILVTSAKIWLAGKLLL